MQVSDTFEIVGVIADHREGGIDQGSALLAPPAPTVYLSYLQNPSRYMHLLVRTLASPANVIGLVQRELRDIDPDLGLYDERTMDDVLSREMATPRLTSVMLGVFASLAVLLSAIGVFGVTSYSVAQRTREFAIRIALGTPTRTVFAIVTQECVRVTLIGIAVGLAGTVLIGRALMRFLYGVLPSDSPSLTLGTITVFVMAIVACWRPAWRATRVDPMTILRAD